MGDTQIEMEDTSQIPNPIEVRRIRRSSMLGLIVFVMLVLISACGNVFLTIYFCNMRGWVPTFSFFVALGLLLAQPCLLSIWLALASERLWVRLVAFTGILGGLILIYLKAFDLAEEPVPMEIAGIIIGIAIALAIVIQTPLWIYRAMSKLAIRLPEQRRSLPATSQFSIKHLLIAMTIAAMIVASTKAMLPEFNSNDMGPAPWRAIISFLLFFVVLIGLLSFVSLAAVFSAKQRKMFVALAVLFFLLAPMASITMMQGSSLFGPMGWDWKATANTYAFVWTIGSALIGVLWIFYLIGYRLEKAET